MRLNILVIGALISFLSTALSLWIRNITPPSGLSLGDGTFLRLEDRNTSNSSFLERLAMIIETEDMGISLKQNQEKKAVQLDFYAKDKVEGRGKKMGDMMFPFMTGAVGAGVITMMYSGVKMIVVKALILAKIAMIFSIIFIIGKLMQKEVHHPSHLEVEQHAASEVFPVYTEYSQSGGSGDFSGSYGGYPYSGYGPSGMAESVLNYAAVEPSNNNGTMVVTGAQQVAPAAKRRDYTRRKAKPLILTIKHYTQSDNGLI